MTVSAESHRLLTDMRQTLRRERQDYADPNRVRKRIRQLRKIEEHFRTGKGQHDDSDELFRVLHRHISGELSPEIIHGVYTELKDRGVERPELFMDRVGMNKRNRVVASYAAALKVRAMSGILTPDEGRQSGDMGDVCLLAMQSNESDVDLITSAIVVRHLLNMDDIIQYIAEVRTVKAPLSSGVL